MAGRLENKVAIVTGGGRGIGEAIVKRLAREGAKVVLAQRSEEEGNRVAEFIAAEGGEAMAVSTDVADPQSVEAMVAKTLATHGRVDVLVNNAGTGAIEDPLALSMENYDTIMDANVRGVLLCTMHAARAMTEAGSGSIVNISSIQGILPLPGSTVYAASKGAVEIITRQTALELGPKGVRVNAVAPGYIDNPMMRGYHDMQPNPETALGAAFTSIALGRFGSGDDVAGAVLFFASDDSTWVTGTSLLVDGGSYCHGPIG
jgi:NAD(P)-dependent dehydrogenase (short-subunit alcohol dehydrogenase family)